MKVVKVLGLVVGALALLLVIAVGALYFLGKSKVSKTWDAPARAITVPTGEAAVAEGKRLYALRGCAECHGPEAAGLVVEDEGLFGTLAGPNLTPGGPLAKQDDAQIARAIRHAVGSNGRPLVGMPPEYAAISDAEMGPLIAYLRSLPTVTAQPKPLQLSNAAYVFLGAGVFPLAAEEIDHAAADQAAQSAPAKAPTAAYGAYLAKVQCQYCHGPELNGRAPAGKTHAEALPTNLTPHPTGLATWTAEQFDAAVRQGKRPDGTLLHEAMPWRAYAQMSDEEIAALWSYLKTVPPKEPTPM